MPFEAVALIDHASNEEQFGSDAILSFNCGDLITVSAFVEHACQLAVLETVFAHIAV